MIPSTFRVQPRSDVAFELTINANKFTCRNISISGILISGDIDQSLLQDCVIKDQKFKLIWHHGDKAGLQVLDPMVYLPDLFECDVHPSPPDASSLTDSKTLKSILDSKSTNEAPFARIESLSDIKYSSTTFQEKEILFLSANGLGEDFSYYEACTDVVGLIKADDNEWYKFWPLTISEELRLSNKSKLHKVLRELLGHVAGCRESLVKFNETNNLEQLYYIGQKYNGVYGTLWNFAKGRPGYDMLGYLSEVVETISRHYSNNQDLTSISPEHLSIFSRAVIFCDSLLIRIKRGESEFTNILKECRTLRKEYKKFDEIQKREKIDQDLVDNLLDNIS